MYILTAATILVTFIGTLVAVPPSNVDNNDCQHPDLFYSTLRGRESPAHMWVNRDREPSVPTKCDENCRFPYMTKAWAF